MDEVPVDSGSYPLVRVEGAPEDRGRAYGLLARRRILGTISVYRSVFEALSGWDWPTVRRRAVQYRSIIEEFSPASWLEIRGISEGAGVDAADVIAINVRSEIMFQAAPARAAAVAAECTSFALGPEVTSEGRLLAGQNWDWLDACRGNVIVLEVRRPDGPDFLTLVEAGLLAKVGLNEAGVGLATNTLVSDGSEGSLGVPYHLLLRSVLDSETGAGAAETLKTTTKANSANYVVVDESGFMIDLETAPTNDGFREVRAERGRLTHANHFLSEGLTGADKYLARKQHSLNRLDNIRTSLAKHKKASVGDLKMALADHRDAPANVCQHPLPTVTIEERTCTLAGVILDVRERRMHLAAGNPCVATWSELAL